MSYQSNGTKIVNSTRSSIDKTINTSLRDKNSYVNIHKDPKTGPVEYCVNISNKDGSKHYTRGIESGKEYYHD